MFRMRFFFILLLVLLSFIGKGQQLSEKMNNSIDSIDLSNWMANIADSTKLTSLSLPGTHNAGARFEQVSHTAKCQELTIEEQLNAGIRFLDLRCRHTNNMFSIYHGSVDQQLTFSAVQASCIAFLIAHPSETILLSIKEEYKANKNSQLFETTLNEFILANPDRWYVNDSIPSLGETRGKLVLLRRFSATNEPFGIAATYWKDNSTFDIESPQEVLSIQDQYKVTNHLEKWNAIDSMLIAAKQSTDNRLYINYTSGYEPKLFGIPNIASVVNFIHPRLIGCLNQSSGKLGIIVLDFATEELSRLIIASNWDLSPLLLRD